MSRRAILAIDLQNDYFPSGRWPLVGIGPAAANAARVLAAARARGEDVIHIRHEARTPDAPFFVPDTQGAEIAPIVAPLGDEAVIVKHYPNSFRETGLRQMLAARGLDTVTIVGAMSHMCIDASARAAVDLGLTTCVLADACATRDLEFGGVVVPAAQVHTAFMAALAQAGTRVCPTETFLAQAASA